MMLTDRISLSICVHGLVVRESTYYHSYTSGSEQVKCEISQKFELCAYVHFLCRHELEAVNEAAYL